MADPTPPVRREGDFPVIVSSEGADREHDAHPGNDSEKVGSLARPGPSPGLPPQGADVGADPTESSDPLQSPTRLPGEPAPLDDQPLTTPDTLPSTPA